MKTHGDIPQKSVQWSFSVYGNTVWLFGGMSESHQVLNSMYCCDLQTLVWSKINIKAGYVNHTQKLKIIQKAVWGQRPYSISSHAPHPPFGLTVHFFWLCGLVLELQLIFLV